jgi:hypothetical protein
MEGEIYFSVMSFFCRGQIESAIGIGMSNGTGLLLVGSGRFGGKT